METSYGRWIGWLVQVEPEALAEGPLERFTIDRFERWIEANDALAPASRHLFAKNILRVLQRSHPTANLDQHWRIARDLEYLASRHVSTRKDGRIFSSGVLLDAAIGFANERDVIPGVRRRQLSQFRDGCLMALFALCPIRCRAMGELRIGTSFLISPTRIVIALDAAMTKTGVPWETEVPRQIAPLLRRYVEEVRPTLLGRAAEPHDHLWVTRDGRPLQGPSMSVAITRLTERLLSKKVSPHLFRDAAATTLARVSSKDVKLVAPLLQHSNPRTAERHYNHARNLEVCRDYASLIDAERQEG
ncbi:tyrosine-type recombinase/integrase [Litorisediminicola beolgyonensis]|uniref:Tyrosine-type recombinase/integrase n=2 Tax=Litorisediminicola beolgyonensis TaxID=1173614 RepID=A0ABW3ZNV1_9RHOB